MPLVHILGGAIYVPDQPTTAVPKTPVTSSQPSTDPVTLPTRGIYGPQPTPAATPTPTPISTLHPIDRTPTPMSPTDPVTMPAYTPPTTTTAPAAAPTTCPDGYRMLAAGSTRVFADGTSVKNTGSTASCFPDGSSNVAPAAGTTATATPTNTGINTSGPTNNGVNTGGSGDPVNRLIDVMSAMYAGAGVKGGGSGFDGLVSGPLATSVTSDTAGTQAGSSGPNGFVMLIVLAVIAGLGYMYYKSHKKHKAGAA